MYPGLEMYQHIVTSYGQFPNEPPPPYEPKPEPVLQRRGGHSSTPGTLEQFYFYNSQTFYLSIIVCEGELETLDEQK